MIASEELLRRLVLLIHALWEAREELSSSFEQMERDGMDWFERERFERALDADRQVLQRREAAYLRDAYRGESSAVRCTAAERRSAVALARAALEGTLSPESALDQLLSDDFPSVDHARHDLSR